MRADYMWTAEDAAVAADAAMDAGVPCAEIWRYLSPEVVQQLATCPALFNLLGLAGIGQSGVWDWAGSLAAAGGYWNEVYYVTSVSRAGAGVAKAWAKPGKQGKALIWVGILKGENSRVTIARNCSYARTWIQAGAHSR